MKRIGHGIRRLLRRDNSSYDLHDIAEIDDMHTKSPAVNTKFVLRDNHDPRRHVIRQNIADKQGVVELPKNANNNNKDEKVVEVCIYVHVNLCMRPNTAWCNWVFSLVYIGNY